MIIRYHLFGLNPCSNGRYSQRTDFFTRKPRKVVLILVLMEDTLRGTEPSPNHSPFSRLNPCSNGRYSQRAKPKSP